MELGAIKKYSLSDVAIKNLAAEHVEKYGKSLSCPVCNRRFSRVESVVRHRYCVHTSSPSLKCVRCERRFGRLDHLKRHAKTHKQQRLKRSKIPVNGKIKPRYVCRVCSQLFSRASGLLKHKQNHPAEPPPPKKYIYQSEVNKAFTDNFALVRSKISTTKDLATTIHQVHLMCMNVTYPECVDVEVCDAFTKLVDSLGFNYHIEMTFTAVVDCGKHLVRYVDMGFFAEELGGPLLLMNSSDCVRGANCIKDVCEFVKKQCDYGDLMAVPSVRFHVKRLEAITIVQNDADEPITTDD